MTQDELTWRRSQFAVHTTPRDCTIFAINPANDSQLDVVTTLDGDDADHAAHVINALNALVDEHDDQQLAEVLPFLPKAVQQDVRDYSKHRPRPDPGTFSEAYGRLSLVRLIHTSNTRDLHDLLEAAYLIGLGVRATNERSSDGEVGWELRLFNAEPTFESEHELRVWSASSERALVSTWISDECPVDEGLQVAREASSTGRLVRLHSCELSDGSSRIVVDMYDAPILLSHDD